MRAILMKIKKAGEDMEENHTFDENEFVETLQQEMPNVEAEMGQTLDRIDTIDQLIERLRLDRNSEIEYQLNNEIDETTRNVEEKE